MTYEEAIKILHKDRALCMFNPMTGVDEPMNEDCRLSAFALDVAIEALEKQIAKKPIDNHHCPFCETGLPHRGITDEWCKCCFDPDYCPECGQAVDWSDDECD